MSHDEILFSILPGKKGNIGEICLNRPKALNALTGAMCEALHKQLIGWQKDAGIKAVIIRGEGERAFCAGGDVRSLYQYRQDVGALMHFFQQEYAMNKAIFHFEKPYISLLDGITMGGGVGVSLPGSHRIASEFFSFAMPETAIGFFPDIGAGYFFNRCPSHVGYYLGLSGASIKVADAVAAGLVQHHVPREQLDALVAVLCKTDLGDDPKKMVSQLIAPYHFKLGESKLMAQADTIERCFSHPHVQDIFQALQQENTAWSQEVVATLNKRSPTSLAVTLSHLQRTRTLNFDEIMQMDFNLAHAFMQSHDFFEGVRAVLIDKDQAPQWRPADITALCAAEIEKYFSTEKSLFQQTL